MCGDDSKAVRRRFRGHSGLIRSAQTPENVALLRFCNARGNLDPLGSALGSTPAVLRGLPRGHLLIFRGI